MDLFIALILGVVQGITEWLPISSSGHLVLLGQMFDVENETLIVAMAHLGSLFAVLIIFWREVIQILKDIIKTIAEIPSKKSKAFKGREFAWGIVIGTIPIAIIGLLFKDFFESTFSSILVVAVGLLITSIFLFSTKFIKSSDKNIGMKSSFVVGCAQALSILPGVSRSGSTISTGMLMHIDKEEAAKFSFILAIPALTAATIFKILEENVYLDINCIIVFISSLIVSILFIKFLLRIIKKSRFYLFGIYCFALFLIILLFI